jgi:hypothetical protein
MAGYINQKPYFAIQNKTFSSQLLLQLLAHIANCRPFVTYKSYSNRTRNPRACGIVKFVPFMRKTNQQRSDDDTKKSKT